MQRLFVSLHQGSVTHRLSGIQDKSPLVAQKRACERKLRSRHLLHSAARSIDSIEDLMKAADELIGKVDSIKESGHQFADARGREADEEADEDEPHGMRMVCDETSCVIVPFAPSPAKVFGPSGSFVGSRGQSVTKEKRPRDFVLSEGEGWKLGYDRDPINPSMHTALVGADSWSCSMNHQEFSEFVQLLRRLQKSVSTLETCGEWGQAKPGSNGEGASEQESSLELETKHIWMQARAPQKQLFDLKSMWAQSGSKVTDSAFHLRFIVTGDGDKHREFEGQFEPKVVMRLLKFLEDHPPAIKEFH